MKKDMTPDDHHDGGGFFERRWNLPTGFGVVVAGCVLAFMCMFTFVGATFGLSITRLVLMFAVYFAGFGWVVRRALERWPLKAQRRAIIDVAAVTALFQVFAWSYTYGKLHSIQEADQRLEAELFSLRKACDREIYGVPIGRGRADGPKCKEFNDLLKDIEEHGVSEVAERRGGS